VLPIPNDNLPVDDHPVDACRVVMGVAILCVVLQIRQIKNDDIRTVPFLEETSLFEFVLLGGQRAYPPDRFVHGSVKGDAAKKIN